MRRSLPFILLICLPYLALHAQEDVFSIRNYTALDGLPQSQVKAIVEDKNGYLWIGTEGGGLARFDGREFKVFTTLDGLLTNQVNGLRFDDHDNLWVLHPRGVTRFDGLSFTKFESPQAHPKTRSLRRMYMLKDTLFVVSGTGLTTKIHQDSIHYWDKDIYQGTHVWAVHVAPAGQVCLLLSDGSFLIRTRTGSFRIPTDRSMGKVFKLFNYGDDVVAQTDSGPFTIDLAARTISPSSLKLGHLVLSYDEKANVFWTSNGNMVFKVKVDGATVRRDTVLRDVDIWQVLNDSEGNTWFASNGGGLFKYFVQDFIRYGSGNIRGVMAIHRDREGASWIGTMNKGLWKIVNGKITSYADRMPYRNAVHCIKESPWGELWVGTLGGLARYDRIKDRFTWYGPDDGLPGWSAMSIEFDGKGMWIGTGNGLCYYDGHKFKPYAGEGLAPGFISTLRYLGKYNTLFVATELTIQALRDGRITNIDIPEIQNTSVISLQPYQDSLLLLGTAGAGVVMYNPATQKRKLFTTREGLASDFVYFVAADEKQYLWIGTEKGINHVKLDRHNDIAENLHFDNDNGLLGVETNQNAFHITPDAKYFGLVDGLYRYNDLNKSGMRSFDIHLTDVKLLYGEHSARDYADSTYGFYKIPYQPVLPPDKNHITFQFNRVDKRYSKSVRYKYFLENFDKTWSQPSTMDQVTYSNLPPGHYVLRVMSTNNRGSWSDTRIAYAFTVRSPFYQTTAFMVGAFVFAGGMITLVLYLRVKQKVNNIVMVERVRQREQELLRKEIARDFHDEMGNQLTRIINYVSLLRLNGSGYTNGQASNGHDLYTKVEDSAKYLYSGTRDFIWSIDPVNDELSKLFIHIRDFGEKLFEEKRMNFRAFNEVREKIRLPYGFSRQANLIFKEAMTNAFKYSGAHNISFTLRREDGDGFEFCFEDDGVGFSPEELEKSNGLQNIRDRANRINAVLRIHSEKQKGTKIVLNFTLNKTVTYGIAV